MCLNIISFLVKVPVLSESKYSILPNSSGILLDRGIEPYIVISLVI